MKYINLKAEDFGEPYSTIARAIGVQETVRIANCLQGEQIYFKNPNDIMIENKRLVMLLGADNIKKLSGLFKGEYLYFPDLKKSCAEKIKQLILDEFNGYNYIELAKKYGYTERHIRNICGGKAKVIKQYNPDQVSLFDC